MGSVLAFSGSMPTIIVIIRELRWHNLRLYMVGDVDLQLAGLMHLRLDHGYRFVEGVLRQGQVDPR